MTSVLDLENAKREGKYRVDRGLHNHPYPLPALRYARDCLNAKRELPPTPSS